METFALWLVMTALMMWNAPAQKKDVYIDVETPSGIISVPPNIIRDAIISQETKTEKGKF